MKHNELFHRQIDEIFPVVKRVMKWSCAIVDRIDATLKEKGMTQRDLAAMIGCNETQITRWTRGFPNFTLNSLAKLSEALGESFIHISIN